MIGADLQKGIYAALTAAPAVAGGRVYDRVPADPKFPYITIGDDQFLDDGGTCGDAWEVFADIHVWSRPVAGSKVEVKDLEAAVIARLRTVTVTGASVVVAALESARTFRDADGITEHAVITMRYLIDPAS